MTTPNRIPVMAGGGFFKKEAAVKDLRGYYFVQLFHKNAIRAIRLEPKLFLKSADLIILIEGISEPY